MVELRFKAKKSDSGTCTIISLEITNGIKNKEAGKDMFYGHKLKFLKDKVITHRM